jgi:hypothetical protein
VDSQRRSLVYVLQNMFKLFIILFCLLKLWFHSNMNLFVWAGMILFKYGHFGHRIGAAAGKTSPIQNAPPAPPFGR